MGDFPSLLGVYLTRVGHRFTLPGLQLSEPQVHVCRRTSSINSYVEHVTNACRFGFAGLRKNNLSHTFATHGHIPTLHYQANRSTVLAPIPQLTFIRPVTQNWNRLRPCPEQSHSALQHGIDGGMPKTVDTREQCPCTLRRCHDHP
jgi:hypothetical protein